MKKIIYILFAFLYTNVSFGQDYNKLAEGAAKDLKVSPSEMAKFKETYIANLKKEQNKKNVQPKITNVSDVCDDGGFETKDFSNWGWTMVENEHHIVGNPVYVSTITSATGRLYTKPIPIIPAYFVSPPCSMLAHANSSWEIVSSPGSDPLIPSISKVHSGNYALRLGDKPNLSDCSDYPWCSAESIKKSITVTATNKILSFWYAVVTDDASSLSNHCCGAAAGFGVRVNGTFKPINPVIGPNDPIYAYSNPGLTTVSVSGKNISYLPWGCSSVDLTQYIGQTVDIEFAVFDCTFGGHFAYAYIDDICMGCDVNPQQSKSCCNNKLQMVTPTAVPPSYPYNEGTYGVEKYNITVPNDVPITEVRVNVMSFEWKSDKEDCKQCQIKPVNLGSLYGGFSIGGIFVGPTLQAYGPGTPSTSNNNEVVFSFPSGKSFVVGDFMRLTYLLPPEKDLTCCQTKAHVCFKISWKDINCGYCEVYTCSDIDLKNPSELRPGFTLPDRTTLYLNSRNIFAPTHANGF